MKRLVVIALCVLLVTLTLVAAPASAAMETGVRGLTKPRVRMTGDAPTLSGQGVTVAVAESEPNNAPATADQAMNVNEGTVNESTDTDDVYWINANAGDVIEARLSHDYSSGGWGDVDLFLFGPGTTDVDTDPVLDFSVENRVNRDYIRFTVPPGGGGQYYVDVYTADSDGETIGYTLYGAANELPTAYSGVERYWGATRYETAVEISYETFPENGCTSAVLASGVGFADALSGAGLAGAVDGPVLLTYPDFVPLEVYFELYRLGVTDVYIIGGTGAVSDDVFDELDLDGFNVERIAGGTRYETAAAVANRMNDADMYFGMIDQAFVVCGSKFPDALAASPWSYANGIPILLTSTDALATPTRTFLENTCDNAYVVGGAGVVSDDVLVDVDAATLNGATRIWGPSRYETARNLAEILDGSGLYANDFHLVGFASGAKFPDALAGGAAMGYEGGVLLLTQKDYMDSVALGAIQTNMTVGDDAVIFGGEGSVSFNAMEDAYHEIDNLGP